MVRIEGIRFRIFPVRRCWSRCGRRGSHGFLRALRVARNRVINRDQTSGFQRRFDCAEERYFVEMRIIRNTRCSCQALAKFPDFDLVSLALMFGLGRNTRIRLRRLSPSFSRWCRFWSLWIHRAASAISSDIVRSFRLSNKTDCQRDSRSVPLPGHRSNPRSSTRISRPVLMSLAVRSITSLAGMRHKSPAETLSASSSFSDRMPPEPSRKRRRKRKAVR